MKHNYIPLEKQSKRKQKEFHAQQRKSWGNFKPATKRAENGKVYNRKKSKQQWQNHEPLLGFFIS